MERAPGLIMQSNIARALRSKLIGEVLFAVAVLALGGLIVTLVAWDADAAEKLWRAIGFTLVIAACYALHRYRKHSIKRK